MGKEGREETGVRPRQRRLSRLRSLAPRRVGSLRAGAAQDRSSPAAITPAPPSPATYPIPPGAGKLSAVAGSGTGPGALKAEAGRRVGAGSGGSAAAAAQRRLRPAALRWGRAGAGGKL